MTTTPARDALRNVICAQAASDTDAEAKLDAHATEAVQQFAEQVAAKLAGCCDECNACIAELRRLAATARPDNTTGAHRSHTPGWPGCTCTHRPDNTTGGA